MGGTQFFYDIDRNIEYLRMHSQKGFTVLYFGKFIIYGDEKLEYSENEERIVKTIWDDYELKEYDDSFFVFKRW